MSKKSITQGHGIKGRFGGLPDPYGSLVNSHAVIIPVPFDLTTTYQKGSDKGPAALIEASRNLELYDIETDTEAYLHGIYTAPAIKASNSKTMLQRTEKEVLKYIQQDKFVITLGGEHSISLAPIKAYGKAFGPISVLQFDAHADLQDAYEGNPYSHASVMARVQELETVKRIISVGIRSMSSEELKNLKRDDTFFAHEIQHDDKWMDKVLKKLSDHVYITFDLDVFDSSVMPSTGTPEPGGLGWYPILRLLRMVAEQKNIIGLDVVELMPKKENPAPDFLVAKLIYKILSYKMKSKESK
jgi:agmatinase